MENSKPLESWSYDQNELLVTLRQSVRENGLVEPESLPGRVKMNVRSLLESLRGHAISPIVRKTMLSILRFRPPIWLQWRWQFSHRKAGNSES